MPDIGSLVTHLPSDKGYTGESPAKGGLPGFVCPRADAYGGREGIISPGVAAVNDLVPRGMRRIATADTAKSANAARTDGRTESDRYLEYYGRAVPAQYSRQAGRTARPERQVRRQEVRDQAVQDVPDVRKDRRAAQAARIAQAAPAAQASPSRPVHTVRKASTAGTAQPASRSGRLRPPAWGGRPSGSREIIADPDDPGMFSRDTDGTVDADTLDGFYDSLGGISLGTGEADVPVPDKPSRSGMAGMGDVPDPRVPRAREIAPQSELAAVVERMAEEKAELSRAVAELEAQVSALKLSLSEAEGRAAAQLGDGLASRAPEPAGETVRVVMSAAEQKLKVGGKHWECRVMGSLHVGRGGRCAVLTVCDPAYASELLAEIQPGEVVVLSETERTYCTYSGLCAKIYGEQDSQDFIAAFWLALDGGRKGA